MYPLVTGCTSREIGVVACRYFKAAANKSGFTPSTTADDDVETDQSTPSVHCCKPLNPLQWRCIAFSPAWSFLYSMTYEVYWKSSIIRMLQPPSWYGKYILLFNNKLKVGAQFAALGILMHP
jgi:hypothetical protein